MRSFIALPFFALLFACSSSTSPPGGSVAEKGNCNADSECAKVAGKELSCLCAPDGTSTHAQCVALLAEGALCSPRPHATYQTPCVSGTYCGIDNGVSNDPVCVRYAARGEDCSSRGCAPGTACGTNHSCGDLRAIGSACFQDAECAADAVCASFKCAAPVAIGQSCFGFTPAPDDKRGNRNPCVAGAVCASGKCALAKGDGASCASSEECVSGLCMMSSGGGKCETTAQGTAEKMCLR